MTGLFAVTVQIARLPFESVLVLLELPPGGPCLRAVGAILLNVGLQRLAVRLYLLPPLLNFLTVLLPVGLARSRRGRIFSLVLPKDRGCGDERSSQDHGCKPLEGTSDHGFLL
ncbi:MAG TPA: hypothetical protein VNG91_08505 [Terriglobia bacterium]|nr:hypothetical protein [Terriglobia bacterium]